MLTLPKLNLVNTIQFVSIPLFTVVQLTVNYPTIHPDHSHTRIRKLAFTLQGKNIAEFSSTELTETE
jgi:hypothetical protein